MHKSFIISEEDKTRILGMHQNATKRQYLSEETLAVDEIDWYKTVTKGQGVALDGVNKIASATIGAGTNPNLLIRGFENMKDFEGAQKQLVQIYAGKDGYKSIQDMLRGEFEGNNLEDIEKLVPILKKLGYSLNYQLTSDKTNLDNDTITITKSNTSTNKKTAPFPYKTPECLANPNWSDTEKVWWAKLSDGNYYAFSPNGTYRMKGSKKIGYYECVDGKMKYSDKPISNKKSETIGKTYKIPTELKDVEGVKKFQDWLDTNQPGWHTKYRTLNKEVQKGYGIYGPNTSAAWGKYGNKYLTELSKQQYKFRPESPSTENPEDISQGIEQPKEG